MRSFLIIELLDEFDSLDIVSFCLLNGKHLCISNMIVDRPILQATINIESRTILFADYCICYREIIDSEDTLKLQEDIDCLGCWARKIESGNYFWTGYVASGSLNESGLRSFINSPNYVIPFCTFASSVSLNASASPTEPSEIPHVQVKPFQSGVHRSGYTRITEINPDSENRIPMQITARSLTSRIRLMELQIVI